MPKVPPYKHCPTFKGKKYYDLSLMACARVVGCSVTPIKDRMKLGMSIDEAMNDIAGVVNTTELRRKARSELYGGHHASSNN